MAFAAKLKKKLWNKKPWVRDVDKTSDVALFTKPGKPFVVGEILIDEVHISWNKPDELLKRASYQIRYKECQQDAKKEKWILYNEQPTICAVIFTNLKSNTKYKFQVRMVNDEDEGPWSDISKSVVTIQSAAHHLRMSMTDVKRFDTNMPVKKLPMTEDRKARNEKAKTRKLFIGGATKKRTKERTIMLVGATGTGKSTLVDGMINYILGVSWNDPYRLTLVDLEEEEKQNIGNQAVSQTQWITCYTLHRLCGGRLNYTLNIIDTPGFGDTRGIEQDKKIIEQIRELFSRDDAKGVLYIDAICFIVKAPDARLTPTQKYIFDSILSLFGLDIKDNFCMLVTFADGKKPPVLAALQEAKLPHEHYLPFNNSGLFAENFGDNLSGLSSMFWEMGCKSFQDFFSKLLTLETKSLTQTRDVLEQRRQIEITLDNLMPTLDAGLNKVEEMKKEIQILEKHKTEIEDNSNFTYEIEETQHKQIDLPKGKHTTNCLNCHATCHSDCQIPNDEDKRKCKAMDSDGNCTQCTGNCSWNLHRNTPYIFEYVKVTKQKTYSEMEQKYRTASDEKMSREIIIQRMEGEIQQLEKLIFELMQKINASNNKLRKIALKPDPLSVVEHIDLLIESEKSEKRPGFFDRIEALKNCRKRATVGKDVDRFLQDSKSVSVSAQSSKNDDKSGKGKGFMSFFGL